MKHEYLVKQFLLLFLFLTSFSLSSFSQVSQPLDIAVRYLQENSNKLNLSASDISHFHVNDLYVTSHNGLTHLFLKQTHEGIPVHNALFNFNITSDGQVVSTGNRFIENLAQKANRAQPALSARDGLYRLLESRGIPSHEAPVRLKETINERQFIFEPDGIALEPVKVYLVYQPFGNKSVRLAWNVELYELDAKNWWNASVDAETGEILRLDNQVIHCDFGASESSCPEEMDFHGEIGVSKNFDKNTSAANTYNVFAPPVESPNHGPRTLETNPVFLPSSPFGWHDTNGSAGAEYTITRGNNVHAYQDIFDVNNSSGDEPDGGPNLDFDHPLDASLNKPYQYREASITNLFYWSNLMHDIWYKYGFDEQAGNFQVNNYGNGGSSSDWVRAEGLDGGGSNNANFGTGADGSTARMQMYIWGGAPPGGGNQFVITDPSGIAGSYEAIPAGFGAPLPNTPIVSELVIIDDGVGVTSDACDLPIVNGSAFSGKMVMIDRGDCQFGVKILRAENEGAIAAIMCNNNPGEAPITMGAGTDGGQVTIPGVMLSYEDCQIIRAEIPGAVGELSAGDNTIPTPGPTARDGDYDNGIIAHEYTHGISIRATGGPGSGGCLSGEEQAGEGWSDWFGVVMTIEPGDQGSNARGIGTYASNQSTTGPGIRTYPYSTNMLINPHTYDDIKTEAIPHGVGSVWAAMLNDLTWALIEAYGFDSDLYNGTGGNNMAMQLVMDGIKIQPCTPGFIDAREAIITADIVNYDGANECLIWEVFARRGLGFSAQQGSSGSRSDGVEAFDIPPYCQNTVLVEKSAPGQVNANGTITYTLEVTNPSINNFTGVTVTDVLPGNATYVPGSASCGGSLSGNTLTLAVGNLDAGASTTCTFDVIAPAIGSVTLYEDDVETGPEGWITSAGTGSQNWNRVMTNPAQGQWSWFAQNVETQTDFFLEMADPFMVESGLIALIFDHSYNTENVWDGGVVEIMGNSGTWQDLGNFMVQNGYNAIITENTASAISQRFAFTGNSNGYKTTIIYLNSFVNQNVKVRFRFASDAAVGGNGWHIDNIRIVDLVNVTNEACATSNEVDGICDDVGIVGTIVLGGTTSTQNPFRSLGVNIYPNPTSGNVLIDINDEVNGEVEITVFSIDGREALKITKQFSGSSIPLDLSSYTAGVYMVEIKTNDAITTKKIILE